MTDPKQTAPSETTLDTLGDNKLVRNLVFFGSGVVALLTARWSIWNEFYHEKKHQEPFAGLARDRLDGLNQANTLTGDAIPAKRHAVEAEYTAKFTEALERRGVSSKWFKGTFDRLKELGKFDKGEIALKTGGSLAVTLGTYYLLNQNMRLKASNQYQDDRLKELGDRIDAAEVKRQDSYSRA